MSQPSKVPGFKDSQIALLGVVLVTLLPRPTILPTLSRIATCEPSYED